MTAPGSAGATGKGEDMSDAQAGDRATEEVCGRLRAAGIAVSDEELAAATGLYRFYQAGLHLLYEPPEVRYAEPAVVFRAAPPFVEWPGSSAGDDDAARH